MLKIELITYQPGNITPDPTTHTLQKLAILCEAAGFKVATSPISVRADHESMGSFYAEVTQ